MSDTSTKPEDEDPLSMKSASDMSAHPSNTESGSLFDWIKNFGNKSKNGSENLREAIEEYIEELNDNGESPAIALHEQTLITNVLKLRDLTITDVMIPRADLIAIDVNATQEDLMELLAEKQFSRIPVFEETLDNVIGTIHIKDILGHMATRKDFKIQDLMREVPIVSPAMPVLDLMMQMRKTRKHMAMVVDEYGGIDGLVTIGDVLEAIVGEIDDEFDTDAHAIMEQKADGSVFADGRVELEEFEETYGELFLSEDQRRDIDTLAGLVSSIAGRVPARGEVIKHDSGLVFEVLDADPRRINKVKIKNIPNTKTNED